MRTSQELVAPTYLVTKVTCRGTRGAQSIFKHNQPLVSGVRTSEIEFLQTAFFCLLYSSPEQHLHPTQSEKLLIGAAVLVHKRTLEAQSKNTCHRNSLAARDLDL